MSLPDYIIIGAMKCGTSTLAAQLGMQDGMFMTTPKEPNFFSDDPIFDNGMDWYRALFTDAKPLTSRVRQAHITPSFLICPIRYRAFRQFSTLRQS